MRKSISKLAKAAAFGLALALTFSCSSSDDGGGGGGGGDGGGGGNGDANEYYRYYSPYTTTAQRCQGGFVESKCGDEWYMPVPGGVGIDNNGVYLYQYCSNNVIVKIENRYERCGNLWYSPSSQRCQGSVVETKCGDELWYNSQTQVCVSDQIKTMTEYYESLGMERCGNTWYDPSSSSQRCRGSVVENKCGDEWYSYNTTQVCYSYTIDGASIQTLIDLEKCGANNFVIENKCFVSKSTYNAETQFCYNESQVLDKCNGSTYDPTKYFCFDNKRYDLCGGLEYNPETQRCKDKAIQQLCRTTWYNIETDFCSDKNLVYHKCEGGIYNPSMQYCGNGILKNYDGSFIDSRDGKKYNYTIIGTQTWMAENLNYDTSGSKCHEGGEVYVEGIGRITLSPAENCDKYGRLYDWATAMAGSESSSENPSGVQGICPFGWHLPSKEEWGVLEYYDYPGNNIPNKKLFAAIGSGTDDYGFSALSGSDAARWWSTSNYYNGAYSMCLSSCPLGTAPYDNRHDYLSVRCVKD
jgi:uncharacterized protein (TIGR02145 family)